MAGLDHGRGLQSVLQLKQRRNAVKAGGLIIDKGAESLINPALALGLCALLPIDDEGAGDGDFMFKLFKFGPFQGTGRDLGRKHDKGQIAVMIQGGITVV